MLIRRTGTCIALTATLLITSATVLRAQDLKPGGEKRPVLELALNPDSPEWEFMYVNALAVDSRGRLYVLEGNDQTIRVFDANGKPLRKFGRKGEGPGETVRAGSLTLMHDTLWLIESSTNRATFFAPGALKGNTVRVDAKVRGTAYLQSVLSHGYSFYVHSVAPGFGTGIDDRTVVATKRDGTATATLLHYAPSKESFYILLYPAGVKGGQHTARTPNIQPFMHADGHAVSGDGGMIVHVAENPASTALTVRSLSPNGNVLWSRTLSIAPMPLTRAQIDVVVDSLNAPRKFPGGGSFTSDRKQILDSLYKPATWPPMKGVAIGIDSTIWIRQGGPGPTGTRYWRLSPKGELETTVQVPRGFVLMQASRTQLWGWRRNADDMPVVERYRY